MVRLPIPILPFSALCYIIVLSDLQYASSLRLSDMHGICILSCTLYVRNPQLHAAISREFIADTLEDLKVVHRCAPHQYCGDGMFNAASTNTQLNSHILGDENFRY